VFGWINVYVLWINALYVYLQQHISNNKNLFLSFLFNLGMFFMVKELLPALCQPSLWAEHYIPLREIIFMKDSYTAQVLLTSCLYAL